MKFSIKAFAIVSLVFLFTSCGDLKTVDKPEDIGPQVFAILEDMDEMTKPQFRQHFLTIEDIHAMAKNESLGMSDEMANFFLAQSEEDYKEDLHSYYKKINKKARKHGIDWAQIEYVDFNSTIRKKGKIKQCDGELKFKHKKKLYIVETISLYDGTGWSLLKIGKPKKD